MKLVNPSECRIEHLITQMKWRLREGDGEAVYEVGVEDNGVMSGLLRDELDSSLNTLQYMASRYNHICPFQAGVAFHMETSHSICSVNQITSFYLKCSTGLKWVKPRLHSFVFIASRLYAMQREDLEGFKMCWI